MMNPVRRIPLSSAETRRPDLDRAHIPGFLKIRFEEEIPENIRSARLNSSCPLRAEHQVRLTELPAGRELRNRRSAFTRTFRTACLHPLGNRADRPFGKSAL